MSKNKVCTILRNEDSPQKIKHTSGVGASEGDFVGETDGSLVGSGVGVLVGSSPRLCRRYYRKNMNVMYTYGVSGE